MKKILIADDSLDIRTTYKAILEDNPEYIVEEAKDGHEVLRKIVTFNPDLVILDLLMPGKSGMELIGEIKDRDIIVLTGLNSEYVKALYNSKNVKAYMLKENTKYANLVNMVEKVIKGLV